MKLKTSIIGLSLMLLLACEQNPVGVEYTEIKPTQGDVTAKNENFAAVVATTSALPRCSKTSLGAMYFVTETNSIVYCDGSFYQDVPTSGGKKDTVLIMNKDTVTVKQIITQKDTMYILTKDTIVQKDTLVISKNDTLVRKDTVVINNITRDTVVVNTKDTIVMMSKDTVVINNKDTLVLSTAAAGNSELKVTWLGSNTAHPKAKNIGDVYYNSIDEVSYIWDGYNWSLFNFAKTNGVHFGEGRENTLSSMTWYSQGDYSTKGNSVSKYISKSSIKMEAFMSTRAGYLYPWTGMGVVFGTHLSKINMPSRKLMMLRGSFPEGVKFRLEFKQSNITGSKLWGMELVGKGEGTYVIPISQLKMTSGGTVPWDASLVTGFWIVNKDLNTADDPETTGNFVVKEMSFY